MKYKIIAIPSFMNPSIRNIILRYHNSKFLFLVLILLFSISCTNDSEDDNMVEVPEEEIPDGNVDGPIFSGETGDVLVYDQNDIYDGFVLVNDVTDKGVYLMSKEGTIIHHWELEFKLGNDAILMDNGQLLVSLKAEDPFFDIGGYGGIIQLINPDGSIEWNFKYSNDMHISHHDIEMLPNGNILLISWEKKDISEALEAGYDNSPTVPHLLSESIIEINMVTNEIVWQWNSWDHLIQDFDDTKNNFGTVSQAVKRIDINHYDDDRGDFIHANGIDYDAENDIIYLSTNFYSEVWVIDHSTTTSEAASDRGGNFDSGGNLIYRFGNPTAYDNTSGTRLFYNNHFPNILESSEIGAGNMLIFMNGNDGSKQSIIYELDLSNSFQLGMDTDNEPEVLWSFSNEDLYTPIVGGAERLPNGNTLITAGKNGIWEVTNDKEIVWRFIGEALLWRSYSYAKNHPGVLTILNRDN